ncbi:MAG: hypothetical protein V7727_12875 [Sneathiella sp.]
MTEEEYDVEHAPGFSSEHIVQIFKDDESARADYQQQSIIYLLGRLRVHETQRNNLLWCLIWINGATAIVAVLLGMKFL